MTKDEAWRIINALKNWNTSYKGCNEAEMKIADEKREALRQAWRVVGEKDPETPNDRIRVSV